MSNFKKGEHVLVEYNSDGKYYVFEVASVVGSTVLLKDGFYTTKWDIEKIHKLPKSIAKELGV